MITYRIIHKSCLREPVGCLAPGLFWRPAACFLAVTAAAWL